MTAIFFFIFTTLSQRTGQLGRGQVCFTKPEMFSLQAKELPSELSSIS